MHDKSTVSLRHQMEIGECTLAIMVTLLFLIVLFLFLTLIAQPAQGQTFRVLHDFTGQEDGEIPFGTPMVDAEGNIYGTAWGGRPGCYQCSTGKLYKLSHTKLGWGFSLTANLHRVSMTGLVHDANGVLYGTEAAAGLDPGAVFELRPSPRPSRDPAWKESTLHEFRGGDDGTGPNDLTIDSQGNLYGTTSWAGRYGGGTVFKLTPSDSSWTYQLLYSFRGGADDGAQPNGPVALDSAGNIYGTTGSGGILGVCGVVYSVTPAGEETVLHYFDPGSDGGCGATGPTLDAFGNLFGGTPQGIYELSPDNDGWSYRNFYIGFPQGGPVNLVIDEVGNLYGGLVFGGPTRSGEVFKLTPQGDGWLYTVLHDFSGPDGWGLYAGIVRDSQGNIFGAGSQGGAYNLGVVFEITP